MSVILAPRPSTSKPLRAGATPQRGDEHQDLLGNLPRYRDLGHRELDVAAMADDLRVNLDQPSRAGWPSLGHGEPVGLAGIASRGGHLFERESGSDSLLEIAHPTYPMAAPQQVVWRTRDLTSSATSDSRSYDCVESPGPLRRFQWESGCAPSEPVRAYEHGRTLKWHCDGQPRRRDSEERTDYSGDGREDFDNAFRQRETSKTIGRELLGSPRHIW